MQQLTYTVAGVEDARPAAERAKEKLAQIPHETLLITAVTQCTVSLGDAQELRDTLREVFPAARILVHTCALKMADMRLDTEGIMLTFTAFATGKAEFLVLDGSAAEGETKERFLDFVHARPETKAIEFLVAGSIDHIDDMFESFSRIAPCIEVFGAFVDAAPMNAYGYVIADDAATTRGMAAVVFHGADLEIFITRNFGWNMLGREIVATRVEGCTIKELDGDVPLKIYEKYFGIKGEGNFGVDAALFPLCFEEADGSISARVPIRIEEGGELTFGIPMPEGTKFRLAYSDPYGILSKASDNARTMADFAPQVLMGSFCVGHYLLFGDDVVSEMTICEGVPSSGSFVFGEVRRTDGRIIAANLNILLVGMKEQAAGSAQEILFETKSVAQLSYNRKMLAFMSHFIRVTEEELYSANQRLSHLASRDALTNLFNRREMERVLKDAVKKSTEEDTPLTVILMDIDHFKTVNDTYGHDMGDKVLLTVADAISSTIRGSDAGCRWGGDEFFVILQGEPLEIARRVGERIRRTVETAQMPFDSNVTVSVGVARFDPNSENELQLFKSADEALYQAKKAGRNAVYCLECGKVEPMD